MGLHIQIEQNYVLHRFKKLSVFSCVFRYLASDIYTLAIYIKTGTNAAWSGTAENMDFRLKKVPQ
jgi:hypothetical protein